jgi:hypothetical protein
MKLHSWRQVLNPSVSKLHLSRRQNVKISTENYYLLRCKRTLFPAPFSVLCIIPEDGDRIVLRNIREQQDYT